MKYLIKIINMDASASEYIVKLVRSVLNYNFSN